MLDKPVFDPGFAFFVYPFADSLDALYQEFLIIKNPKTRKFKFQMYHSQIVSIVKNNVAFYLGCLMWAKILKESMPEQEIENNPFLDIDFQKENISDAEFCAEIDYLINYLQKYTKDCKFYLGKDMKLPEKWQIIAELYKEFLLLNKSFVKTKETNDLVIPNTLDKILKTTNDENKELIEKALNSQDLTILLQE